MAADPELRRAGQAMQPGEVDVHSLIAKRSRTLRDAVFWSAACLLLFFAVDCAVFHSGWYMSYLEPNSSAGQLESRIFWLEHEPETVETAVFGDSRIGEGFSALTAQAATDGRNHFRNMGVGGATPRVSYYLLRDADPERKRFSTVVFALDRYSDLDGEDQSDRIGDLNYLVGRLRLYDCPEFAFSFRSEFRSRALAGCLLRGIPLRDDLHSLLEKPLARFRAARVWRNDGHGYLDGYSGKEEDLAGLTVDYATRTIRYPAGARDWQRDTVRATLLPDPVPQVGTLRAYRRKWLGKIVDFYAGSKTRVVFIEMPRGPVHPLESGVPAYVVNELKTRPNVIALPPETFHDLERPELFADGLHLNRVGRPIFSEKLARLLAAEALSQ